MSLTMTEAQRRAAKTRFAREAGVCCPLCGGKGRILSRTIRDRGKKGGNAAYLQSLEPGQLSMSDRGKRGGRPRALTIESLGLRVGDSKEEAGAPNPTEAQYLTFSNRRAEQAAREDQEA